MEAVCCGFSPEVVEQRKENVKMRIVDISSTLFDSAADPMDTRCCMMFQGFLVVSFPVWFGAGKLVFLSLYRSLEPCHESCYS